MGDTAFAIASHKKDKKQETTKKTMTQIFQFNCKKGTHEFIFSLDFYPDSAKVLS
jgi:hypothetical protein